jgi:hypothetical protein
MQEFEELMGMQWLLRRFWAAVEASPERPTRPRRRSGAAAAARMADVAAAPEHARVHGGREVAVDIRRCEVPDAQPCHFASPDPSLPNRPIWLIRASGSSLIVPKSSPHLQPHFSQAALHMRQTKCEKAPPDQTMVFVSFPLHS